MKIRISKKVAAVNVTAKGHPAEDSYMANRIMLGDSEIVFVAASDGCTSNSKTHDPRYQPELGANWITEWFTLLAEKLYREGLRGLALGAEIVRLLTESMCNDRLVARPKRSDMVTTLLGFIANDKELLLITAGDGNIILNGVCNPLPVTSKYPINQPEIFRMEVYDINEIHTFAIATDGLTDRMKKKVTAWSTEEYPDPADLVETLAVMRPESNPQDDATIIVMSVRH